MKLTNNNYFIVPGFAKCGTTWLYNRLSELPDFEMPVIKEMHYFNRDSKYNTNGENGSTLNYFINRKNLLRKFKYNGIPFFWNYIKFYNSNDHIYKSLFGNIEKISGDITPIYCMLGQDGVKKMSNLIGIVKIIFILRDPIDRDWSQFRFNKLINGKRLEDFNSDEIITYFKRPSIISRGNYIEAIENYKQSFPESKMLITFYDDLKINPRSFLEEIVEFLDGDISNIKSHSNFQMKSHVSEKAKIPANIYEYLKTKNKSLVMELSNMFGGHCTDWLNQHYGEN